MLFDEIDEDRRIDPDAADTQIGDQSDEDRSRRTCSAASSASLSRWVTSCATDRRSRFARA